MIGFIYPLMLLAACTAGLVWSSREFRLALSASPKQIPGTITSLSIQRREVGDNDGFIVAVEYSYIHDDFLNRSTKVSFFADEHIYTTHQAERVRRAASSGMVFLIDTSKGDGADSRPIVKSVLVCDPWFHLSSLTIWLAFCWVALFVATIIVTMFGTQPGTGDVDIPFKG